MHTLRWHQAAFQKLQHCSYTPPHCCASCRNTCSSVVCEIEYSSMPRFRRRDSSCSNRVGRSRPCTQIKLIQHLENLRAGRAPWKAPRPYCTATFRALHGSESDLLGQAEGQPAIGRMHQLGLWQQVSEQLGEGPGLCSLCQPSSEHVAGPEAVLQVLHRAEAAQAAGSHDRNLRAQRLALLHAVGGQQHRVACRSPSCARCLNAYSNSTCVWLSQTSR